MVQTNKACDIFFEYDDKHTYMDTKKKLKYKYVKNNSLSQMDRLKLILNIKAV